MQASLERLRAVREANLDKKISFVSGNFSIIHAGHIRLLRFAKEMADILVVGVNGKDHSNERISEEDRLLGVEALHFVDVAYIRRADIFDELCALRPDFVVKGKEHETHINMELAALSETGGRLVFTAGTVAPSAVDDLLQKHTAPLPLAKAEDYLSRHAVRVEGLQSLLHAMAALRVSVVGDVIADKYITCDALGMSQEDPTIVVSPASSKTYLGGAGIVAAHAAGLGVRVRFFSTGGADATLDFVRQKLTEYRVEPYLFPDSSRPTTLKQRFRCQGKTLLRVNHLRQHTIDAELCRALADAVIRHLPETDLLVFSDFNYGCLPQTLVDEIMEAAAAENVPVVADSQSSSQVGDVSRFRHTLLLTPTEREARLAVHDFESGLVVLAEKLRKKALAAHVIITLGASGILIQCADAQLTDRIPALNTAPADTAGAGDSLLIATSLAMIAGGDIWHAAYLGSLAAAVQVSRVGNMPITIQNLDTLLATL